MGIVARKPKLVPVKKVENATKERKKRLPPDEYRDEIEPKAIPVDEDRYIVVSVKRGGEYGLPCLDIRWYQTTSVYTGFTKRGINIPIEYLGKLMLELNDVVEEVSELGLTE